MEENIENNRLVMEKLQNFLQKVEAHNAIITATTSLDDALTDAIDQLKRHVQEEIESIRSHTIEASQDLEHLMHNERGQLDRLNHLEELGKIQQMIQAINSMKFSYESQNVTLSKQIDKLSQAVSDMRGDNSITASIGLPPFVLWIVAALVGGASLMFIISHMNRAYDETSSSHPGNSYSTKYMPMDTVAVDTIGEDTDIWDTVAIY